jgi:hypothetical protein
VLSHGQTQAAHRGRLARRLGRAVDANLKSVFFLLQVQPRPPDGAFVVTLRAWRADRRHPGVTAAAAGA